MLRVREPWYRECAHRTVRTEGRTPEEVADEILLRVTSERVRRKGLPACLASSSSLLTPRVARQRMLCVWVGVGLRHRRDRRQLPQRLRRPTAVREEHPLARLALRPLLPADPGHRQHPHPRLVAPPRPLPELRPTVLRSATSSSSCSPPAPSPASSIWKSAATSSTCRSCVSRRSSSTSWGLVPWQAWAVFVWHAMLLSFLIITSFCDLQYLEVPAGRHGLRHARRPGRVGVPGLAVPGGVLPGPVRRPAGRRRSSGGAVPVAGLAAVAAAGLAAAGKLAARPGHRPGRGAGRHGHAAGRALPVRPGPRQGGVRHRRRRRDDDGRQLPRLAADADRLLRRRLCRPVFRRVPAGPPRRPGPGVRPRPGHRRRRSRCWPGRGSAAFRPLRCCFPKRGCSACWRPSGPSSCCWRVSFCESFAAPNPRKPSRVQKARRRKRKAEGTPHERHRHRRLRHGQSAQRPEGVREGRPRRRHQRRPQPRRRGRQGRAARRRRLPRRHRPPARGRPGRPDDRTSPLRQAVLRHLPRPAAPVHHQLRRRRSPRPRLLPRRGGAFQGRSRPEGAAHGLEPAAQCAGRRRRWRDSRRTRRSTSSTPITPLRATRALVAAETDYPTPFASAVWRDNVFATQFHPEKSQRVGLEMLRRFAEWK